MNRTLHRDKSLQNVLTGDGFESVPMGKYQMYRGLVNAMVSFSMHCINMEYSKIYDLFNLQKRLNVLAHSPCR